MRVARPITLTDEERSLLDNLARNGSAPERLLLRVKIILLAAKGLPNNQIAAELITDPHTVGRWRSRFFEDRFEGLKQRKPQVNGSRASKQEELTNLILNKTTTEEPTNGSRWTIRTLAAELGISRSTVHRVWQSAGLRPHLRKNGDSRGPSERNASNLNNV